MGVTKSLFRIQIAFAACAIILLVIPAARAQQTTVHLDPAQTQIAFTLGATMHTVHGTFQLKRGEIAFDPATGKASGSIVIDALSGDTGNGSRDHKMHREVLDSSKYSEIVFTPQQVLGSIAPQGVSQVQVPGVMRLHGADHNFTLMLSLQPQTGGRMDVATRFSVPYIQWGLKNPSTFVLRVSDTVDLEIHATATISPAPQSGQ